jgi:ubiquinone/menaquinone biosynthesis C-methylase UbiE
MGFQAVREEIMAYNRMQAAEEFARWSESYDRCILQWLLFGPSHRAMIRRLKSVSAGRPLRILDIGCGTGQFAARVRAALPNSTIYGIDLSTGMLEKGKPRWEFHAKSVFPVQGDSERLPFDSASFDVVTCANSFHHYPRQERAIAEMRRVLRTGGHLMIVDGYRDAPWGWFIYDVCVACVEGDVHHASSRRFSELLTQAGFKAVAQTVHRGLAPFLMSEGVTVESSPSIPSPHFSLEVDPAGRRVTEPVRASRN